MLKSLSLTGTTNTGPALLSTNDLPGLTEGDAGFENYVKLVVPGGSAISGTLNIDYTLVDSAAAATTTPPTTTAIETTTIMETTTVQITTTPEPGTTKSTDIGSMFNTLIH